MGDLKDESLWSLSLDDTDLQSAFDIILDVPLDELGGNEVPLQDIINSEEDRQKAGNQFSDDLFNPTELNHYEAEQQQIQIKIEDNSKPWKEARTSQFQRSGEMTMEKWQWNQQLDPVESKMSSSKHDRALDPTSFNSYAQQNTMTMSMTNIDDYSSSDDGEGGKGDKSKRRSNVREHSKAQREKRKAVVMDMENAAKTLTNQLNDMETLLRSTLEHIAFKRSYFHETISAFLTSWCGGEDRVETWQSLVDRQFTEMALPMTTTRYYPPGQFSGGRRVLKGLNQVIADASSFALLCSSITSRGNVPISSFTFSAEVPLKNFLVDVDTAFGSFRIFTKSAVLSGGKKEINLKGFMRCGYSSSGNLQWVDLYYDEIDLQNQLISSFGEKVYQGAPNIFQMVTSLHEDRTLQPTEGTKGDNTRDGNLDRDENRNKNDVDKVDDDELVVIETSLSLDLRVTALSPGAIKKIGSIVGRTLISADWVNPALLALTEYAPYSCVLDSRTQNGYQSKILCQIYPFSPEKFSQSSSSPVLMTRNTTVPAPSKLLWIMTEWTTDDVTQIYRVLHCQLSRLLHFATNLHTQFTTRTGRFCPKFAQKIEQIETIANFELPSDTPVAITHIVEFMRNFLSWVELLESEIWVDDALLAKLAGGSIYGKHPPISKDNNSGTKRSSESEFKRTPHSSSLAHEYSDSEESEEKQREGPLSFAFSDSWSEYENQDISLFLLLSAEIDQIFVTIRNSSCCPNIISLLQQTADREQTQIIETYISYCLTKHVHPRIRYLMKLSQDLIRSQQLDNAVHVLTEIIGLDVSFLEAYNRRATALYGLRRVQECFGDLEYVLKHNPLHYGALCGKGLMLMNLKAYTPAIAAFQTVLHINPKLANSEAILINIRHCRQYEWQSSQHQMTSPTSPSEY